MLTPSQKESQRKWYLANRERMKEKSRRFKKTPRGKEVYRKSLLKRQFGLSLEKYTEMFNSQSGLCAICNKSQSYKMLAVDHNHKTGRVRGLLCSICNTVLGLLYEDMTTMKSMMDYIQKDTKLIT